MPFYKKNNNTLAIGINTTFTSIAKRVPYRYYRSTKYNYYYYPKVYCNKYKKLGYYINKYLELS